MQRIHKLLQLARQAQSSYHARSTDQPRNGMAISDASAARVVKVASCMRSAWAQVISVRYLPSKCPALPCLSRDCSQGVEAQDSLPTCSRPSRMQRCPWKKLSTCFWGPWGTLYHTQSLAVPMRGLRPRKAKLCRSFRKSASRDSCQDAAACFTPVAIDSLCLTGVQHLTPGVLCPRRCRNYHAQQAWYGGLST